MYFLQGPSNCLLSRQTRLTCIEVKAVATTDRAKSTLNGLTFPVVQMIAARAHARGSVRGGPLAVVRAERDSPASHRACFRGPRRAELAAPLGPALQAAVAERSSTVGRRASARAHGRFNFQTTGNGNSSLSRGLGASCGLKF